MQHATTEVVGIERFIDSFLEEKKHLGYNLSWLSKETAIPYTSLSRLRSGKRKPNPPQITAILQTIGRSDLIKDVIKHYYPKAIISNELFIEEDKFKPVSQELDMLYRDPKYFPILIESFTKKGMTLDRVKEKLGNESIKTVKELIEAGIIKLKGNKLVAFDEDTIKSPSGPASIECIRQSIDKWDKDKAGTQSNAVSYQTYSMNKEVSLQVYKVTQIARNMIREFVNDGYISKKTQAEVNQVLYERINNEPTDEDDIKFVGIVHDNFDEPKAMLSELEGLGVLQ